MDSRKSECYARYEKNGTFGPQERFCQLYFDGIICWPATRAGEEAIQSCPHLDIDYSIITSMRNATRKCGEDGTWSVDPEMNYSWANYCNLTMFDPNTALINFGLSIENIALYQAWLPVMKTVSHVGYWISLVTLLLSVAIIISIKKLQCARNILHMHLFFSFIMRAAMFLLKEFLLVEGVALKNDIVTANQKVYITENYHWICKAITSLRNYFIQANFVFILMEGIYLHNLIFCNLFSDMTSVRIYYLLGWGIPVVFISIWVKLRHEYDDTLCWTTSQNQYFKLLVQTPIEISVIINFALFISITRILCLKINSMYLQQKRIKYRRLIRSTLTLVLIYGVPWTISTGVHYYPDEMVELVWIFCDQTFTAFQGLFMGLIYCLMNGEVKTELKHKYSSIRDRRQQKRRSRTISNTQCVQLQEEGAEPLKVQLCRTTENL